MKISPRKRFYHGSPVRIEQFDSSFMNKGAQALGSGFYFSDDKQDALSYADTKGNVATGALAIEPTLHTVLLDIKKPLIKGVECFLSTQQVKDIISHLPDDALYEALIDFGDVDSYGVDRVLRRVASVYSGEVELSYKLFCLANDLFDDHIDLFNRAVRDVLGYDALVTRHSSRVTHVCAWFPEQIRFIDRQPAALVRLEDDLSPG